MTIVTIEDLINELTRLKGDHGNLEIVNDQNDYISVEFNEGDDGDNEAFVIS